VERNDRELIRSTTWNLPGRAQENYEKLHSQIEEEDNTELRKMPCSWENGSVSQKRLEILDILPTKGWSNWPKNSDL
jgi:hypothetical protein